MCANMPAPTCNPPPLATSLPCRLSHSRGPFQILFVASQGSVKCWGDGSNGRLGYDSTSNKGASPGADSMSNLEAVNLGEGKTAISIGAGERHTCTVLNDGNVKCWGVGTSGQLGYDAAGQLGDSAGEMAALGTVNLGTGKTAVAVSAGASAEFTCCLLNDGSVKCWVRQLVSTLRRCGSWYPLTISLLAHPEVVGSMPCSTGRRKYRSAGPGRAHI